MVVSCHRAPLKKDEELLPGHLSGIRMKKKLNRHLLNIWPPFLGAGIRIRRISEDLREMDVEMKLRLWNRNYVGTHYGGSLYSMTDPFYMVMLIRNLGPDYVVWDKAAAIRFRRPGKGTVRAEFRLTEERIQEIVRTLETQQKTETVFRVLVQDVEANVIAEVEKTIYIAKSGRK
jgi:acyl-coenzyme A thioesterase PaaI-like protein